MKYLVDYQETLCRTFIVEADNEEEAENKVITAAQNGVFELTSENYLHDSSCVGWIGRASEDDEGWYADIDELIATA